MSPQEPGSPSAKHERERTRSLLIVAALLVFGLLLVVLHAALAQSASWLGLQLMVAGAAAMAGLLLGFLFGIPRTLQRMPADDGENGGDGGGVGSRVANESGPLGYRSNTNLEQISDWLTKIIVGVGLTQLHQIWPGLRFLSEQVVEGYDIVGAVPFTASSLVLFTVLGFLLGYLWTRLVYADVLVMTELGIVGALRRRLARSEDMVAVTAMAAGRGVGKLPRDSVSSDRIEALATVPDSIRAELPSVEDPNDPNKGRFGGRSENNGRVLSAEVTELPEQVDWFLVTLSVRPTERGGPLREDVYFYLHPTFPEPIERVSPRGNIAHLELISYGAFTVGVLADGGDSRLELDLSELQDAPMRFRER